MFEFNIGIYINCAVCGRQFWSEDGYNICSLPCDDRYQNESEDDDNE